MDKNDYMQLAIEEAKMALDEGEIPIGAILVKENEVLGKAHNTRESTKNPLHHAEIHLLEQASTILNNWRLMDTTLYVTVEPCPMCLGALLQARVGKLVYGCGDPKRQPFLRQAQDVLNSGHGEPVEPSTRKTIYEFSSINQYKYVKGNNHQIEIVGEVLEKECAGLLKDFFSQRR